MSKHRRRKKSIPIYYAYRYDFYNPFRYLEVKEKAHRVFILDREKRRYKMIGIDNSEERIYNPPRENDHWQTYDPFIQKDWIRLTKEQIKGISLWLPKKLWYIE